MDMDTGMDMESDWDMDTHTWHGYGHWILVSHCQANAEISYRSQLRYFVLVKLP